MDFGHTYFTTINVFKLIYYGCALAIVSVKCTTTTTVTALIIVLGLGLCDLLTKKTSEEGQQPVFKWLLCGKVISDLEANILQAVLLSRHSTCRHQREAIVL